MTPRQLQFFATRHDLEPGLRQIESFVELQYVLSEMSASPQPVVFRSLLEFPRLGVNNAGSQAQGDMLLIMYRDARVHVQAIPQRKGGMLHTVNQSENPDSIVFFPGGMYSDGSLIAGKVGTISYSRRSIELFERFSRTVLGGFEKIKAYRVGPEATALLDSGHRLVTMGIRSPPEYDLRRED